MNNKKTGNFKVNGIHCNGCVLKINKSLDSLNIDHQADVNIESGNVKVIFDSTRTGISEIKSKIIEAGFQVESIELE